MKRILAILSLIVICLAASAQPQRGQLKAGAAKVDVTPAENQLGRNTYGILDRTHVRAIIFTNGKTWTGPNIMGRLLMELRDPGCLEYNLPPDAISFPDLITFE